MQAVDMLACNQNSGNSSLCKVPQSTGYLIQPDCAGPGGDLSLYLRCSCYKKEAGRDVSGWNPGAGKVIHLFVPISMWEMWPESPINLPGGRQKFKKPIILPWYSFQFRSRRRPAWKLLRPRRRDLRSHRHLVERSRAMSRRLQKESGINFYRIKNFWSNPMRRSVKKDLH